MTIAVSLKVHDGLVLASDSASTVLAHDPQQRAPVAWKVYDHACKITNLVKGKPLGCITWGLGQIKTSSISTLTKDLRQELTSGEKPINDSYTVENVAERLRDFINVRWREQLAEWPEDKAPELGFLVGGYSRLGINAEEYMLGFGKGDPSGPTLLRKGDQCGATWNGEPEAISRLVFGVDPAMVRAFQEVLGANEQQAQQATELLRTRLQRHLVHPAMPIQDAIELARFLVEVTIGWKRFTPGAPTVGGTIEIAAITKHEGFKWVDRKHYFSAALNPSD